MEVRLGNQLNMLHSQPISACTFCISASLQSVTNAHKFYLLLYLLLPHWTDFNQICSIPFLSAWSCYTTIIFIPNLSKGQNQLLILSVIDLPYHQIDFSQFCNTLSSYARVMLYHKGFCSKPLWHFERVGIYHGTSSFLVIFGVSFVSYFSITTCTVGTH